MYKKDIFSFFGYQGAIKKISTALGISHSAVSQWPELIPKGAALELEKITNGALKCDLSVYKSRPRRNKRRQQNEV